MKLGYGVRQVGVELAERYWCRPSASFSQAEESLRLISILLHFVHRLTRSVEAEVLFSVRGLLISTHADGSVIDFDSETSPETFPVMQEADQSDDVQMLMVALSRVEKCL